MNNSLQTPTISAKALFNLLCPSLLVAGADACSHVLTHDGVAPMHKIPSEQWIQKIIGDLDKPGQPFVIRIHHDPGYVVRQRIPLAGDSQR